MNFNQQCKKIKKNLPIIVGMSEKLLNTPKEDNFLFYDFKSCEYCFFFLSLCIP